MPWEGSGGDGEVKIADEVELLVSWVSRGEVELFGMRDADSVIVDLKEFGGVVLGGGFTGIGYTVAELTWSEMRFSGVIGNQISEGAAGDGIEAVVIAFKVRRVRGLYAGGRQPGLEE